MKQWDRFFSKYLVFPCQYHSTIAPHSSIHAPAILSINCVCHTPQNNYKPFKALQSDDYKHKLSFIYWHVQNVMIPCRSKELLPFLSVINTFLHQLSLHSPSLHLAIYFLVCLFNLLIPNSYTILFWEFSVHAQTNTIYVTLWSLL
jgi:hypothetical protein